MPDPSRAGARRILASSSGRIRRGLVAASALAALAAAPVPPAGAELAGSWGGVIEGASAVLHLRREGPRLVGSIALAETITLSIRAEGADDHAVGVMTLLERELETAVELSADGDVLTLIEHGSDPRTGEPRQTTYVLQRLPPPEATRAGADSLPAAPPPPPPHDGAPREPCFTGLWRWSESRTSGTFTSVVESFLQLDADGRAWLREGSIAAGDATASLVQRGEAEGEARWWKIEEGVLLLAPADGSGAWEPIAHVSCSDDAMLWSYEDGSRRLWYRQ